MTKRIRKDIVVEVNLESYRINKTDKKTFTLEHLGESKDGEGKWYVWGYYGNIGDLVYALIKTTINVPHHDNLIEQVKLLREELKSVEKQIVETLTPLMEEVENV